MVFPRAVTIQTAMMGFKNSEWSVDHNVFMHAEFAPSAITDH
jgi:hypothetical protein